MVPEVQKCFNFKSVGVFEFLTINLNSEAEEVQDHSAQI